MSIQTIPTIDQSINLSVEAAVSAHTGSSHDITQYMLLWYDTENYVEVGYRSVNGTLSVKSRIVYGGTLRAVSVASVPSSTTFRIRLAHDRAETLYKDASGAWTFVDSYHHSSWAASGWKAALGVVAVDTTSAPTFAGTFDNFRAQFKSASGLEDVTPESLEQENNNAVLVAHMRDWQPKVWEDLTKGYLQPAWTIDTFRAQVMIVTETDRVLYVDSTTGVCYEVRSSEVYDDQEFIVNRYSTKILDGPLNRTGIILNASRVNKRITWAEISGNWGLPFTAKLISYPRLHSHKKTVSGYGNGAAMDSTQMANNALANTDYVSVKVKWKRLQGTAMNIEIDKMDGDSSFSIEEIFTELQIARSRI